MSGFDRELAVQGHFTSPEDHRDYDAAREDLIFAVLEAYGLQGNKMEPKEKSYAEQAAKKLGLVLNWRGPNYAAIYRRESGREVFAFYFPSGSVDAPDAETAEKNLDLYKKLKAEFDKISGQEAEKDREAVERTAAIDRWEKALTALGFSYLRNFYLIVVYSDSRQKVRAFQVAWPDYESGYCFGHNDLSVLTKHMEMLRQFRAELAKEANPLPKGWRKVGGFYRDRRNVEYTLIPRDERDHLRQFFDWQDREEEREAKS